MINNTHRQIAKKHWNENAVATTNSISSHGLPKGRRSTKRKINKAAAAKESHWDFKNQA